MACANLAVHELNTAGGLLGRPVKLHPINAGKTAASAVDATRFAIEIDEVAAIVGMVPSYAREPLDIAIGGRVPFVYTPQFEGLGAAEERVVTTGETSRELLLPAVDWLGRNKAAKRYFLCGSDYVWPRSTFATARHLIREAGGIVTGEMYLPLETEDFEPILDAIVATQAQVVLPYFLGSDQISFNRAFAEADLARKVLRFTSAIDETILYGLSEGSMENLYVSSAYFSNVRSHHNGAFLERYHTVYGDIPPPANAFGQSCYEGIHCLSSLAEAAGTLRVRDVRKALGRSLQKRTARGLDDHSRVTGSAQPIHFARVDGYEFTVLQTT